MAHGTRDGIVHWAAQYDLLVKVAMLGREGRMRERMLDLARIAPGESVLDVGCGTGTLAIAAKRRVGDAGRVDGVDASPEMIQRAVKKSKRAHSGASFRVAHAESLPFETSHFDVVLSTVMLHHLRRDVRAQAIQEMRRVLKPGGRILIVDFGKRTAEHRGLMAHFHQHGRVSMAELIALVESGALRTMESGSVGIGTLIYVLATR
ncbi:MAG TPA: class I SAM-dependent methyltransferase [Gemmatimonadaceae bacterium]|jgi:ubiquinone/menaquinone biosynthesis C-methylase UbiE|nr:class I SAM-dependent methyltransferase [Gemmatimonadaceae bacterium]